jgi:hypothetical protein
VVLQGVPGGQEEQARLGAELALAQGDRGDVLEDDVRAACRARRRGDHDRVQGAEFAVEGDRVGAAVGQVISILAARDIDRGDPRK